MDNKIDKFEFIKCNLFGTFKKSELERLNKILDEYFSNIVFDLNSDTFDTLIEDNRFYHKFNTYLQMLILSIDLVNDNSVEGFKNEKENN